MAVEVSPQQYRYLVNLVRYYVHAGSEELAEEVVNGALDDFEDELEVEEFERMLVEGRSGSDFHIWIDKGRNRDTLYVGDRPTMYRRPGGTWRLEPWSDIRPALWMAELLEEEIPR